MSRTERPTGKAAPGVEEETSTPTLNQSFIESETTTAEAPPVESLSFPETARKKLPIERLAELQDIKASVTFNNSTINVAFEGQHESKGKVDASVYCRASINGTLMIVESSQASGGGGPIAYDIAMEIATQLDKALASDRARVSDQAMKVWEHYHNNRPDVQSIELEIGDFYLGRKTEGPEFESVTEDPSTWPEKSHPIWSLWCGYQKQPDIITALKKTDQITIEDNR